MRIAVHRGLLHVPAVIPGSVGISKSMLQNAKVGSTHKIK